MAWKPRLYRVDGTGFQSSAAGRISVDVGWINAPSVESVEGFGVETGISGGEGVVDSVSIIFTKNAQGELVLSGFMLGIGLGGESTGVDEHIAMSQAEENGLMRIWLMGVIKYEQDII